jgi:CRISPR system Cascade subunit CasB
MKLLEPRQDNLPDFVTLQHGFETLGNGPKAELRRVSTLDRIADMPAYYRWLATAGQSPSRTMERIAFLIPLVAHSTDADSIGRQLFKGKISEMRLFQMLRAESPRDIEHLRRLIRHLEHLRLNWERFGRTLYYWGPMAKRGILQEYFTTETKQRDKRDG